MIGRNHVIKLPSLRLTPNLAVVVAFALAAFLSVLFAWASVLLVERISERAVRSQLLTEGVTYVTVNADGLRLQLMGTAPNEAARYRVINMVGTVIEASRIQDLMEVTPIRAVEAPRFSLEMLRTDDGIQLIGLLPEGETKDILLAEVDALQPDIELQDMLETAAYAPPPVVTPVSATDVSLVQRANGVDSTGSHENGAAQTAVVDLDAIARDVYPILRRMLQVDRERRTRF